MVSQPSTSTLNGFYCRAWIVFAAYGLNAADVDEDEAVDDDGRMG